MCPGKFQAHHLLLKEVKMKQLNFKLCLQHDPMNVLWCRDREHISLSVRTLHSTDCLLSPEGLSKILYLKPSWIIRVWCEHNIPFQWCSSSETSAFCISCTLENSLLCSAHSQNSFAFPSLSLGVSGQQGEPSLSSSPSLCAVLCCFLWPAVFIVMVDETLIYGKSWGKIRSYSLCEQFSLQVPYTLIYCTTTEKNGSLGY